MKRSLTAKRGYYAKVVASRDEAESRLKDALKRIKELELLVASAEFAIGANDDTLLTTAAEERWLRDAA